MKTTITADGVHGSCAFVTVHAPDLDVTYFAPTLGGYVRVHGSNRQVCVGLTDRGPTLRWDGNGRLVDLIRAQRRLERARRRAWLKS